MLQRHIFGIGEHIVAVRDKNVWQLKVFLFPKINKLTFTKIKTQ